MSVAKNLLQKNELIEQIESWNIKFPFDHAWREKYKIPFGSQQHRSMSFFDIKFDIVEGRYFEEIKNKILHKVKPSEQLLKSKVVNLARKKDIDSDFDNLDLSQYDNIGNG